MSALEIAIASSKPGGGVSSSSPSFSSPNFVNQNFETKQKSRREVSKIYVNLHAKMRENNEFSKC